MNLNHTHAQHERVGHWVVDFVGDDGEAMSVGVTNHRLAANNSILEHAKHVMIELTDFGTRGGKPTSNRYDALSSGDLENEGVALEATH